MAAHSEETIANIEFAKTAFAEFKLTIKYNNNGIPIYEIRQDSRIITALAQKLTHDFRKQNITPNLASGNTTITLSNDQIQQMRIAVDRHNRFWGDGEWTGNFHTVYTINITDLMPPSPQPAPNLVNPQAGAKQSAPDTVESGTLYFKPSEVKNIFQKLNADPGLIQQFLRDGGKSYNDTLQLRSQDESLYTNQQVTNLRLAISLLYQINVAVNVSIQGGYELKANTPAEQHKLQQIKMGGNQSQNPYSFLSVPSSHGQAPVPNSGLAPQQGIIRRGLGNRGSN